MTPDDLSRLRVGDEEREVAAAALGEAYARGRLDDQEYAERLDAAWTSRTRGDLDALFHDLPVDGPRPAPVPVARGGSSVPKPLVVVGVLLVVMVALDVPGPLVLLGLLVALFATLKARRRRARRDAGDPYWR